MRRFLLVGLTLLLPACGEGGMKKRGGGGASGGVSASLLNGDWEVKCEFGRDGQYHTITLSINAPKVTETDYQYLDQQCNQQSAVITKTGNISDLVEAPGVNNAHTYTLSNYSVIGRYLLSSTIAAFNEDQTCNKTDWKLHEEVDMNAICGVPDSVPGVARLDNDKLYFGNKSVMGEPAPETAAERLERTWVFSKSSLY